MEGLVCFVLQAGEILGTTELLVVDLIEVLLVGIHGGIVLFVVLNEVVGLGFYLIIQLRALVS